VFFVLFTLAVSLGDVVGLGGYRSQMSGWVGICRSINIITVVQGFLGIVQYVVQVGLC